MFAAGVQLPTPDIYLTPLYLIIIFRLELKYFELLLKLDRPASQLLGLWLLLSSLCIQLYTFFTILSSIILTFFFKNTIFY